MNFKLFLCLQLAIATILFTKFVILNTQNQDCFNEKETINKNEDYFLCNNEHSHKSETSNEIITRRKVLTTKLNYKL